MATGERMTNRQIPEPEVVTITVGVDGRVYFHDLTPEVLSVAAEICPNAPAVLGRQIAQRDLRQKNHDQRQTTTEEK